MCLLTLILCTCFWVHSQASAGVTSLTTVVPGTVLLDIDISGRGTVEINGSIYHGGSQITIPRNSPVAVIVTPDSGWSLWTIRLNGQTLAVNGTSCQLCIDLDSHLVVSFVESGSENKPPQTGDSGHIGVWLAALVVSGCVLHLFGARFKRKHIHTNGTGDQC